MPKSRIPAVEIEFGGKTRHLIFGHHALGELEEHAAELGPGSRIKRIILALWAGLLTETLDARGRETADTLSQFQITQILDGMEDAEIQTITDKILEAKGIAKPDPTPATVATPPA